MYLRVATLCAAALLAVSPLPADDKPAAEKPTKGLVVGADLPGPFHPFNVANGKYVDKFHCVTNEHGLNPGVLIFAQNAPLTSETDPLPQLLQQLDDYAVQKPKTRLNAFAVFLFGDLPDVVKDDDVRLAHVDALRKLKNDEKHPLQQAVLCLDSQGALQKAGYDVRPDDQVVVVLYDQLKVKNVYHYGDGKMSAKDVKAIMDEVKKDLAPFKK